MRERLRGYDRASLALATLALLTFAGCENAAPPAPAAVAPDPVANLDLRLVGQNDLRLPHERPRYRHTLLLAA